MQAAHGPALTCRAAARAAAAGCPAGRPGAPHAAPATAAAGGRAPPPARCCRCRSVGRWGRLQRRWRAGLTQRQRRQPRQRPGRSLQWKRRHPSSPLQRRRLPAAHRRRRPPPPAAPQPTGACRGPGPAQPAASAGSAPAAAPGRRHRGQRGSLDGKRPSPARIRRPRRGTQASRCKLSGNAAILSPSRSTLRSAAAKPVCCTRAPSPLPRLSAAPLLAATTCISIL